MIAVAWYSMGGHITEEEQTHEVKEQLDAKARRGKFFGLVRPKT
jgi:iron transport multicopper oxidase